MSSFRTVLAAGAVVWRRPGEHLELLVVHRPTYDDWTFPKGKADPGERLPATAVRELHEETSVRIRLGAPLPAARYPLPGAGATKQVSYWIGHPLGDGAITLEPNPEIDAARWRRLDELPGLLTYDHDRELLAEFRRRYDRAEHHTGTLIVLRHATARPRRAWTGDDRSRPLSEPGRREAERLAPLLAAYGVAAIVSSDATRCVESIEPYANQSETTVNLELDPGLAEDRATANGVAERVRGLLAAERPAALCTHRPVLPLVFEALGLPPVPLEPAQLMVVHHHDGRIVATELHHA